MSHSVIADIGSSIFEPNGFGQDAESGENYLDIFHDRGLRDDIAVGTLWHDADVDSRISIETPINRLSVLGPSFVRNNWGRK